MFSFLRRDLPTLVGAARAREARAPEPAPSRPRSRSFTNALALALRDRVAANRYPQANPEALRDAIAEYVRATACPALRSRAPLTAANVLVDAGAARVLELILKATCVGGRGAALLAEPTCPRARDIARALGIEVVAVGRADDDLSMDLDGARAELRGRAGAPVRVVFVGHPNTPTGNPLTPEELAWLRSIRDDALVVIDEREFEYAGETLAAEAVGRPNWIVLRSFSRAFGLAEHPVGYVVAHPVLITALAKVQLPDSVPATSVIAAWLALQHRHALLADIPALRSERRRVFQQLDALALASGARVWPGRGDGVFMQLVPLSSSESHAAALARRDRVVESLQNAGLPARAAGDGLRLGVGAPQQNHVLVAAVGRAMQRWGHGSKRTRDARRKRRYFSGAQRASSSSSGSFIA